MDKAIADMNAYELWRSKEVFFNPLAADEIVSRLYAYDAAIKLLSVWATLGDGSQSRDAMAIVSKKILDEMYKAKEA
jgi:hypothetical protein